jgi:hypothetical protein
LQRQDRRFFVINPVILAKRNDERGYPFWPAARPSGGFKFVFDQIVHTVAGIRPIAAAIFRAIYTADQSVHAYFCKCIRSFRRHATFAAGAAGSGAPQEITVDLADAREKPER